MFIWKRYYYLFFIKKKHLIWLPWVWKRMLVELNWSLCLCHNSRCLLFLFYRYEIFTGRVLLAALDHNFHVFRKTLEGQFKKIYSKRSGNWRAEAVKEAKQYEYFALLQADILRRRAEDPEPVTRHIEVSPTNPVHLAPTIAMKQPPPTEELVKAKLSRFKSSKKSE